MKVLIIDDSALIRQRLVDALLKKNENLRIECAPTAEEARKLFSEFKPDIVSFDISLPDESGISLLETFKSENPDIKSIVFTNYPLSQIRKVCMDLGADYFFYKANDFESAVTQIAEIDHR